ncbi:zinc finger and SCAN domain-containing protein 29-like [Emydura macquarii macquarii]|uniref:zinc finger and SCAN domain-containing protein 29-like n=1 Tax=Emydura macquarii macquarii TaxID=1129001 RepID=UPI00352B1752
MLVTACPKLTPGWSQPEVLDLIGLWGEESVLGQLQARKINMDIYERISHSMLEKGHNRDAQQCHVKIKELRQAYQKTREANSHSGSSPKTYCFYEELHEILGGNPTTMPSADTELRVWRISLSDKLNLDNRKAAQEYEHSTQDEMLCIMRDQSNMLRCLVELQEAQWQERLPLQPQQNS